MRETRIQSIVWWSLSAASGLLLVAAGIYELPVIALVLPIVVAAWRGGVSVGLVTTFTAAVVMMAATPDSAVFDSTRLAMLLGFGSATTIGFELFRRTRTGSQARALVLG